ncbi:MAG: HmuY family protein [Bacteroidota bacterium]
MNRFFKSTVLAGAVLSLLTFNACEEDLELPDNLVDFESAELGFGSAENELTINLTFSRAADGDGTLNIHTELTDLAYGIDFVTEPASSNNALALPVAGGAATVSFKVKKVEGVLFDGDESIRFTLQSADVLVLGERKELVVSFAEIVAAGATVNPNVGGAQQPNKVFIDLSASRQQSLARNAWDLGFANANGVFRAVLNSSSAMMARAIDKTDLNAVTAADTVGFGVQLSTDAVFAAALGAPPAWLNDAKTWVDDPSGDITKTAIAEISATAADNKVYIINRGKNPDNTQRGWKKVRIIRNGTGYTVQHADINATAFQTIEVTRNEDFNFSYINFASGSVEVEPRKDKWDIGFSVFTNITPLSPTVSIPYVFTDVVLQNSAVEAVQILNTDALTYNNFTEANLTNLAGFSSSQLAIGTNWRSGGGPNSLPAVRTDRFYVVKDGDGNYYKIRFTAMSQNGERGRPQFEYALVKKGS